MNIVWRSEAVSNCRILSVSIIRIWLFSKYSFENSPTDSEASVSELLSDGSSISNVKCPS